MWDQGFTSPVGNLTGVRVGYHYFMVLFVTPACGRTLPSMFLQTDFSFQKKGSVQGDRGVLVTNTNPLEVELPWLLLTVKVTLKNPGEE